MKWQATLVTLVEETLQLLLCSPMKELFESVELYPENIFNRAGHLVDKLEAKTTWLLLQSPGTEIGKSVELYLGDGLEMSGHTTVTLGRDSSKSWLIHIMVLKYMSFCGS